MDGDQLGEEGQHAFTREKEDRQQAAAGFPSAGPKVMACYVGPGMVETGQNLSLYKELKMGLNLVFDVAK